MNLFEEAGHQRARPVGIDPLLSTHFKMAETCATVCYGTLKYWNVSVARRAPTRPLSLTTS
jgi:hypothetical protein